ncbi:MAG: signal peptide peptidase SppA [Nitrospiraceae bacterium]
MPNWVLSGKALAIFAAAVLLDGCITINLIPTPGPLKEEVIAGAGDAKILLVEIAGVISSAEAQGLVEHPSLVARIKEELTRAADDRAVKAIILRINSPGGTVTASDIIYHELRAFREKRKVPIVASILDVGASGGYYIAMAADKVVIHPSSVTGSIGVIMFTANASGLLEKIGVETTAVMSGPKKDMGSPFRGLTPEERAIFQSVINSFYERFLSVVQEGRPALAPDQIRKLADGRIYSGEQAKAVGLVDEVGYLDEAIELAKRQAEITEARVVVYRRAGEYRQNIYSRFLGGPVGWPGFPNLDFTSLIRGGTPQFMYLWMP